MLPPCGTGRCSTKRFDVSSFTAMVPRLRSRLPIVPTAADRWSTAWQPAAPAAGSGSLTSPRSPRRARRRLSATPAAVRRRTRLCEAAVPSYPITDNGLDPPLLPPFFTVVSLPTQPRFPRIPHTYVTRLTHSAVSIVTPAPACNRRRTALSLASDAISPVRRPASLSPNLHITYTSLGISPPTGALSAPRQ